MPSQSKIIHTVNRCLKQKSKIDFELNKSGVCAGLAGLYVKYALENKTNRFFEILDRLGQLPPNYQLGDAPIIDDFIIQIEKVFNPRAYSNYQIGQEDLEMILRINNKPITNEFNFGLITEESRWEKILHKITRNNRAYSIMSINHAIAISYKNCKYSIYDPNYTKNTKTFTSAKEVLQELKNCFDYTSELKGLNIRVFAHPESIPETYPDHEELHSLAFVEEADKKRTILIKKNQHQSLQFAVSARDRKTFVYLMDQQVINWDEIASEYHSPEFNSLLIEQPPSSKLKNAILTSISLNLLTGNVNTVKNLVDHYKQTFTSIDDQKNLRTRLQDLFNSLGKIQKGVMVHEANFSYLLKLCEEFALTAKVNTQTNYNHLKLLSLFAEQSNQDQVELFLNTLAPAQVILQIQSAAIFNKHLILNVLINHLKKSTINPQLFPPIFTEQMIETINVLTLKILLENGFIVNIKEPNLLVICTERKDKSIFELVARAFSKQMKQSSVWEQIDTHSYSLLDLTTMIGPVLLINTLILLRKNEHIKNAWREDIDADIIKSALVTAISTGNTEICAFLQKKLESKSTTLEEDTIAFLYRKALKDEDLSVLANLAALNFNIFTVSNDVEDIFFLCIDNNDYSLIELSLHKASPQMKQKIIETALKFNAQKILGICAAQEPQLFNHFLNHWMNQESSSTRDNYLLKINNQIKILPVATLIPKLNELKQKAFFSYCFHQKLFLLADTFSPSIHWAPEELIRLIDDLIKSKNEEAIILLLQNYPQLREDPALLNTLLKNNLLKPIAFLLSPEIKFSPEQYEEIFVTALSNNDKNLIDILLVQQIITPETRLKKSLSELLESAIKNGSGEVLEPFINSSLDYGLNFKHLFFLSCTQKQTAIANQLLAKNIELSEKEVSLAAKQLFDEQASPAIFETIYQNTYGRLYQLIIKANFYNPRTDLLNSIKSTDKDPKFKITDLYLSPLKRAFKEKNISAFIKLLSEVTLPKDPDSAILRFLEDPFFADQLIKVFKNKYTLEQFMNTAFAEENWAVIANLIEEQEIHSFSPRLQEQIRSKSVQIINAFITNLAEHYETDDVRARLYQLLYLPSSNAKILNQLAIGHYEHIQKTLVSIELNMISKKLNLNGQIYRHTYSNKLFNKGFSELNKAFAQSETIIKTQKIDLALPIENPELISNFALIKQLMAKYEIPLVYFNEQQYDLFYKLGENPRLQKVCQQELTVYNLIKQFNLAKKPLSKQSGANQQQLSDALTSLNLELNKVKLPLTFIIPEIQSHLKCYQTISPRSAESSAILLAELKDQCNSKAAEDAQREIYRRQEVATRIESKINAVLNGLSKKIGGIDQHHFKEAYEEAMHLLRDLEIIKQQYLINIKDPKMPFFGADKIFIDESTLRINQAKEIFDRDLDWGDYFINLLKDFANAVITIVTFGEARTAFFAPNRSESIKEVEAAELQLDFAR